MKYYIHTQSTQGGKILGFYTSQNKPENKILIEVSNADYIQAQKYQENNTIAAENGSIVFSLVDYRTQEEILKEKKQDLTLEVDKYIQKEVDKYNKTNGTLFANVHNCATYVLVDTYPHKQFCIDIVNFNATVWEKARSIEADVLAEKREMPTIEEFIAELPVFGN